MLCSSEKRVRVLCKDIAETGARVAPCLTLALKERKSMCFIFLTLKIKKFSDRSFPLWMHVHVLESFHPPGDGGSSSFTRPSQRKPKEAATGAHGPWPPPPDLVHQEVI